MQKESIDAMDECCESPSHICKYPIEVLFEIFKLISAKDLTNCRRVCKRWRGVIDTWSQRDTTWRQYCISDHNETYEGAKKKSFDSMSWNDIYRSLTLWDRLGTATESIDEFCHSSTSADEIRDSYFLRNGNLLVHKRNYIAFYDISTLEMTKQDCVTGEFVKFLEGDEEVVTHNVHLHLTVVRKPYDTVFTFKNLRRQDRRFQNIKLFVQIGRNLYFVDVRNQLYQLNLVNMRVKTLERPFAETIAILSNCNGILHLMTMDRRMYVYDEDEIIQVCCLDNQPDIFNCIYRYKLFEHMEWYTFYIWAIQLRARLPTGPLLRINVMKQYGNIIFIGTNSGSLLIYNKPITNGALDFFNHHPVKEYNFSERSDIPVLSQEPVIAIEVLEIRDGHKILAVMPKKIVVITLTHNFDVADSVALQHHLLLRRLVGNCNRNINPIP